MEPFVHRFIPSFIHQLVESFTYLSSFSHSLIGIKSEHSPPLRLRCSVMSAKNLIEFETGAAVSSVVNPLVKGTFRIIHKERGSETKQPSELSHTV